MQAAGIFTKHMWETISNVYEDILRSDFVTGLAKGTLAEKSFKHYLSQDILYIQKDALALKQLSKRASNTQEQDFFLRMSKDCIEIENILHNDFLKYFDAQPTEYQSPAFNAYSDFIIEMSEKAPYPVAVGALLPCFWLYGKVGYHIIDISSSNNKYQKFIDTYSGDEYNDYTKEFIGITEYQGNTSSSQLQKEIIKAFQISSHHELSVFLEATELK